MPSEENVGLPFNAGKPSHKDVIPLGHPNVDLEPIWSEISNMPTLPPCLAVDRSTHCSNKPIRKWSEYAKHGAQRDPLIGCVFYPSYESISAFSWTVSDPLSPETYADDGFLYITETEEAVQEYPLFLPWVESMLQNLRRTRGQIRDIIWKSDCVGSAVETRFQLSMSPGMETTADPAIRNNSFLLHPFFHARTIT